MFFIYIRFIRLPLITLSGSPRQPGPASISYFEVPVSLRNTPGLNYPAKFRSELSLAFSRAYMLKPHAIMHSYLTQRPLCDFIDEDAYAYAHSLYSDPLTPVLDLLDTEEAVLQCRDLFRLNQLPSRK
jgi:hypothetical protein